jgi:hypothetical protein
VPDNGIGVLYVKFSPIPNAAEIFKGDLLYEHISPASEKTNQAIVRSIHHSILQLQLVQVVALRKRKDEI